MEVTLSPQSYGYGDGEGSGDGYGYGYGYGEGEGSGSGSGSGSGEGYGYGEGSGDGYGYGYGYGGGGGSGSGEGSGDGYDYLEILKGLPSPVPSNTRVTLGHAKLAGACSEGVRDWLKKHNLGTPLTFGQLWLLINTDPWVLKILLQVKLPPA